MEIQIFDPEIEAEIFGFDESKDRRQRKTHKAVERGLIELLQKKDYDQITISELTEVADINRKTFYNNYESIDDVIESIEKKLTAYIFSKLPKQIDINNEIEIYNFFNEFTRITEPYKKMIQRITRHRGVTVILEKIENTIAPYIERSMMKYHIDASVIPYVSRYITSGMTSIFYEWFKNDTLSSNQISKLAYNLIAASVVPENYKDI